jgi:hypothetical protein
MLPGNSVSTVSDYRLDDRETRVRSPAEAKDLSSSLCVQTGLGRTQPPFQWVPWFISPGVRRGRGVTLKTTPIYPLVVCMEVARQFYFLDRGIESKLAM